MLYLKYFICQGSPASPSFLPKLQSLQQCHPGYTPPLLHLPLLSWHLAPLSCKWKTGQAEYRKRYLNFYFCKTSVTLIRYKHAVESVHRNMTINILFQHVSTRLSTLFHNEFKLTLCQKSEHLSSASFSSQLVWEETSSSSPLVELDNAH